MDEHEREQQIHARLHEAWAEASAFGFDAPSERAMQAATRLLRALACQLEDLSTLDLAIAEDGTVAITLVTGAAELLTVEIPPAGSRLEMAVRDLSSGEVSAPARAVTEQQVMERIERAA